MATDKGYLNFLLDQLSGLDDLTARQMMGEYLLYYRGKIAAYVCDDRLLVRPVAAAKKLLPDAPMEPLYAGARKMLLVVENIDDREHLTTLFEAIWDELPAPKPKKRIT